MDQRELNIAGLTTTAIGDPHAPPFIFVLLHGFAMRPADLSPFAHSLGLDGLFLFPRGPFEAQLQPGVASGQAWWRIDPVARAAALARGPRDFATEHPAELPSSRARLAAFLDALPDLIGAGSRPPPIVLGGFSQGGMLVCDTFLRQPRGLAGLVLLSASRIAFDEWSTLGPSPFLTPATNPRVFVSHGQGDTDLAFSAGLALRDHLTELGADVTWTPFEQGHEIPLLVWRGLRKMLQGIVAAAQPASGPARVDRQT